MGTMLGFQGIPENWKVGLKNIEDKKLKHCDYSLKEVYEVNYRLAEKLVEKHGGSVEGNTWKINVQEPEPPAECEVSFEGLKPKRRINLHNQKLEDVFRTTFKGKAVVIHCRMEGYRGRAKCELRIDGDLIETYNMNGELRYHRFPFFWYYDLKDETHQLEIRKLEGDGIPQLTDLLIYQ